ncbi:MAG TPA: YlxR family protein [Bacillota bacterium]|nr:YlxR family protein [Bacillota bacterium]
MGRKKRKVPLRKCVVTQEMLPKQQLIRIVRNKAGEVFIDLTGKQNGRGAYLSKDMKVIEKAEQMNVLKDHLNVSIDSDLYKELKEIVQE